MVEFSGQNVFERQGIEVNLYLVRSLYDKSVLRRGILRYKLCPHTFTRKDHFRLTLHSTLSLRWLISMRSGFAMLNCMGIP